MNSTNSLLNSQLLMLRCPDFGKLSNVAASVLEDELTDLIDNYDCIAEDGICHHVHNDRIMAQVTGRLFDHDGNLRVIGPEHDYWNLLKDPIAGVKQYAQEVNAALESIMDNNHEQLVAVSTSLIFDSVRVIRRFPDLWIVEVNGALI